MFAWQNFNNALVKSNIFEDWIILLNDKTKKEQDYQKFLRDHAGMFIPQGGLTFREQLVLEKVKLGADHITDFVSVDNDRSDGFKYTLIEIESPHDKLFNKNGCKSGALVQALQQVDDWKRWISANKDSAMQIFPSWEFQSSGVPPIKYLIIIGRRLTDRTEKEKRKQIIEQTGVEIRSFDYLSDIFNSRRYNSFTAISSASGQVVSEEQNNEFTNPFYIAYPDETWRRMTHRFNPPHFHMVSRNISTILSDRKYNNDRLKEYQSWATNTNNNAFSTYDHELKSRT